jgi:hypothetical protein
MQVTNARQIEIRAGPFGGVVDSTDPNESHPTRLFDAVNMYVPDPSAGSAVLARHGFQGQTTQLGGGVDRKGQGVFTHRRDDGNIDRFTFGGGRMYRWDGGSGFVDVTPANVKISADNPVFCATYNDEVVISDETNKPWIFTPSNGGGTIIEYNSAGDEWATKGGPVVYGGFVFFIVKAIGVATLTTEAGDTLLTEDGLDLTTELLSGVQNTIAWGNALDARTGYDQLNYDHTWELTQTSSQVLGALAAQEGALLYFRNEGIGYVSGAVDADFRTSATLDSISQTRGTDTPAAIVAVDRRVYFVDLDGRLFRCVAGGGEPEQLWFPVRRQFEAHAGTTANREQVRQCARGAYHPGYDMLLFTIWDRQTIYAFDARSGQYVGQWQVGGGIHVTAMGASVDNANRSVFLLLGTRSTLFQPADLGVVWKQKFPSDPMMWLDQADAAVAVHTPFPRAAETHWLVHKARHSSERSTSPPLSSVIARATRSGCNTSCRAPVSRNRSWRSPPPWSAR